MTTSFTNSTFNLATIKSTFSSISKLRTTSVAREGYTAMGMDDADVVAAIQALKENDFYKTMPSEKCPQYGNFDVYKSKWNGLDIYMKFQNINGFIIVSFKER